MTKLRLAPDLSLPDDAVTQRLSFVGRPGSGKSYMATKLAELLYDVGAQFVAVDPVGIWYGVRADGAGKGINVPVFGGLHGDVPLEPGAGAFIADLIVDRGLSCVLDVSQFETDTDKARFASAFAERFFFRKKGSPSAVMLFLEECQEFVPQNPQRGEERMLHNFTRIGKIGRNFGIGIGLITQRPQEVNKKVLNLTEALFAFQMTGVHERKAIRDWVSSKGADEDIIAILPTLKVGVAHVYSPQWLGVSQQVKAYEKRSADVSSTPTLGAAARAESRPLAPSELATLTKAMAATIEKAKAEDPRELRKRIAELEKAAKVAPAAPVLDRATLAQHRQAGYDAGIIEGEKRTRKRLEMQLRVVERAVDTLGKAAEGVAGTVVGVKGSVAQLGLEVRSEAERTGDARPVPPSERGSSVRAVDQTSRAPARSIAPSPPRQVSDSTLGKTPQRMLNALRFLESVGTSPASRAAVGGLVGISADTGTFRNYMSDLRGAGYIVDGPGTAFALTAAGRAAASDDGLPTTRAELHDTWASKLGSTPARMFRALIEAHPDGVSRAQLGEAVGIDHTTGTFRNYLSDLRSPGLMVDVDKATVRAADALFPEGLD